MKWGRGVYCRATIYMEKFGLWSLFYDYAGVFIPIAGEICLYYAHDARNINCLSVYNPVHKMGRHLAGYSRFKLFGK